LRIIRSQSSFQKQRGADSHNLDNEWVVLLGTLKIHSI
jgi:hypothetical protein